MQSWLLNAIDLLYCGALDDLHPLLTFERTRQLGGLDNVVEALSENGLVDVPESWCQQHKLSEIVTTSLALAYAMSDRRSYVWRRLFTGPCYNSWMNIAAHGPQVPQCDGHKHFQTLLKWRLILPLCSDFLCPPPCPGCNQQLDFFGDHILCCQKMGLYSRHNSVRDVFFKHSAKLVLQPCQR